MRTQAEQLKKIAHVIIDDKFIDMAFREFEEVIPGRNQLIIIGEPRPLQYVKSSGVRFCSIEAAKDFIHSEECGAVVFHSLPNNYLPLLKDIPASKKVIWVGWGYDYYERLLSGAYPNGLLLPLTKRLSVEAHPSRKPNALMAACKKIIKIVLGRQSEYPISLLSRVNYFSPVLDVEYAMALELNPWFKPQYICWNYGTAEDDLGGQNSGDISCGENILIGNNASAENNHLEVFELLKKHVNWNGRKILVPLSYGNEPYRRRIIEIGHQYFGDQFVPLTDFLPKDAYIELLDGCGYVFMNHLRQQAMANLIIMMLKGAKIYMNAQSPAFKWFVDKGAVIYSIDTLASDEMARSNALTPLSENDRKQNISIVKRHWGRNFKHEKTRKLVDVALGSAKD